MDQCSANRPSTTLLDPAKIQALKVVDRFFPTAEPLWFRRQRPVNFYLVLAASAMSVAISGGEGGSAIGVLCSSTKRSSPPGAHSFRSATEE